MRVLAFAAAVEAATGLLVLLAPSLFASLLLGAELSEAGQAVGRLGGIALLALVLACSPGRDDATRAARRALLLFSVLTALFLAYLGLVTGLVGPLLWPAAVLHGIVAILLLREGATK